MSGPGIDLAGRTALVTGSGQGVGLAIARGLGLGGAQVWLNDIDEERAGVAAEELKGAGIDARSVCADVTEASSIAGMSETTGPVDILVNNAGVPPGVPSLVPFVETSPQDWAPWTTLNFDAVLRVTHTYLPTMTSRGWGRVLTVVSDAGRRGEAGQVIYGAAKAGAMGFSRGLAVEVGRFGVTVNCIALGAIRHGAVAGFLDANPDAEKKVVRAYPLGRMGTVEDPAPLAVLLCSDAASWITGQVYPVDGGYTSGL
ncbi:MAG: 3-oxoacyl-[acyl-carrier-protein] reductase FabG [Acidimicrobiales bacterium]|nr:MAG: SDR family oxidoreductase [Actinomycetota bacterium]MBV6508049.1 3-oxoacyl-[acyl-carrier-protein] reductase FabG [Acidimicrobiales bacterium]RIK05323.1 MAG: oxidoreductase [Acidobacteriota bacterium]